MNWLGRVIPASFLIGLSILVGLAGLDPYTPAWLALPALTAAAIALLVTLISLAVDLVRLRGTSMAAKRIVADQVVLWLGLPVVMVTYGWVTCLGLRFFVFISPFDASATPEWHETGISLWILGSLLVVVGVLSLAMLHPSIGLSVKRTWFSVGAAISFTLAAVFLTGFASTATVLTSGGLPQFDLRVASLAAVVSAVSGLTALSVAPRHDPRLRDGISRIPPMGLSRVEPGSATAVAPIAKAFGPSRGGSVRWWVAAIVLAVAAGYLWAKRSRLWPSD